jgi:hypothetical protein
LQRGGFYGFCESAGLIWILGMTNKRRANRILWIECIGFFLIIALSWVDELAQLPRLIFGGVAQPNWRESALESLVILAIWLCVFAATRRLLKRFYYLEDQLKMCAWCRRLETGGEWLSLEDYLHKELSVTTSHGICTKCGRQLLEDDALVEK